jgi:prepilin-type N-terminal cleavage/methylation domain-containing protein
MKNLKAFTLAEIIITIAIVGVVAALTIPSLIANYKSKILKTQFYKSYSMLKQMYKMMEADDISLDFDNYTEVEFRELFQKYLKGATYCGTNSSTCFGTNIIKEYSSLTVDNQGTHAILIRTNNGVYQLMSGETLLLGINLVSVDINGYKNKPNKFGYDVFMFVFSNEGIIPMGGAGTLFEKESSVFCDLKEKYYYSGFTCAKKALKDPDYFKNIVKNVKIN